MLNNNIINIRNKWLIFFAVSVMTVMSCLDVTITNLALAPIAKNLHASMSQIQWVTNIYLLVSVIVLVFSGRLADIIGRRFIYVSGVIIFTLASIMAGFAVNQYVLIVARGLQGMGFGCALTLGVVIVTSVFPRQKRGMVLGNYVAVVGFAQAIGPTVGGIILQYLNWRWIFFINIPLGVLSVYLTLAFYHKTLPEAAGEAIDFLGFILLGTGLFTLVFALNEMGDWGIHSIKFITIVIIAFIAFVLFYFKEKKTQFPLIDFNLFRSTAYTSITVIRGLYTFGWMSILFVLPLYMQNILQFSPLMTGLLLLFMTVILGVLSIFVGRWLDLVGFRKPAILSVSLALITFILFANLRATLSLPLLVIGLVLYGFSAAIQVPSSIGIAMDTLPQDRLGVGMGAFYTASLLGCAIGVAVTGSLLELMSARHVFRDLAHNGIKLSAQKINLLQHIANGAHSVSGIVDNFAQQQVAVLTAIAKNSFIYGLSITMYVCAALIIISIILSFLFLLRVEVHKK